MSDHQYHSVLPTSNNLNGFSEFDVIDFLVTGEGRALVPGSIYIDFQLEVFKTGTTPVTSSVADDIIINNRVGAGSVFDSFSTETQSKGSIESLQNYSRYCNIVSLSTKCDYDLFNSHDQMAGVGPYKANGKEICQPNVLQKSGAVITRPKHFVVKPKICFNRSQGGNYDFDKNGYIKVSTTMARVNNVLYGFYSATTDQTYRVSKIALKYQTIPKEQASSTPMIMNSYVSIKSTLNSTQNMIQSTIPSKAVSGVIATFIKQSDENVFASDALALQRVHLIDNLRFLFNSNLSERIAYKLTDINDMVDHAVQVLNNGSSNGAQHNKFKNNDAFVIGLDFKDYLDLSQVNFQLDLITKESLSGTPVNAYLYFMTLISM